MKSLIMTFVLVSLCAAGVRAEGLGRDSRRSGFWDFTVQTRYTTSHDYSGAGGSSLSLEDDLGWGFGLGYNINEHVSIGGFVSWRTVDYTATAVDQTDPDNTTTYSSWLDTGNMALSATWNILAKAVTPYVTGSIGWAMADTNILAGIATGCWWDPWWGTVCGDYPVTYGADGTAYSMGYGIFLQPKDSFFLRVGYDKSWFDINGAADDFDIFRLDLGFMYR